MEADVPVRFSWTLAANATQYDLYVWKSGTSRPATPTVSGLTQTFTTLSSLERLQSYEWQVVGRNSCFATNSPVYTFTTSGLPDLTVSELTFNSSVPSGTVFDLSYQVSNVGNSSTGTQSWVERVYLSPDLDLRQADDILLGTFPNLSYLVAGGTYEQRVQLQLPPGLIGVYKLFVIADQTDAFCNDCAPGQPRSFHGGIKMVELDEQNNWAYSDLTIYPSPAPDLQVSSVAAPISAFGGDSITLTYTLSNLGDAALLPGRWTDEVWISQQAVFRLKTAACWQGWKYGTPSPYWKVVCGRCGYKFPTSSRVLIICMWLPMQKMTLWRMHLKATIQAARPSRWKLPLRPRLICRWLR
ncbi:MAG: hypothetical protein D6730_11455 [Bacteroidetes bacterium]|nr:MAG: hypothetical protein D6730_11455 [Bacteroidota bacterium]